MDQVTFHYDTVLSDVHMHRPRSHHLMTHLNHVGQPVFVSRFRIQRERAAEHKAASGSDGTDEDEEDEDGTAQLDEDGDFEVTHRPRRTSVDEDDRELVCPVILKQSDPGTEPDQEEEEEEEEARSSRDVITIEHTMATPLEDVGKQIWRGALLMADFILSEPLRFRGATVLELGGGTGFTSVVMATTAKTVYCTDVGEDLLRMCEKNVALNRHLTQPGGGEVRVRRLDWLQQSLCTDVDAEFSWSEEEVCDLHDNTTVIVAADVCYDDDLTDALFRTLYKLCSNFSHTCTVFISIEKRMNFTLRNLDVTCEAYNHFRRCLEQLQELQPDGRCSFRVEQLASNFQQFLRYERIEHLELWKVTAAPLPGGLEDSSHHVKLGSED